MAATLEFQPRLLYAKPRVTAGLLPASFGSGAEQVEYGFAGAYASVAVNNKANFRLWTETRLAAVEWMQAEYRKAGLSAPALMWDNLWARVNLPVPDSDGNAHVRLVRALSTNYGDRLLEHIADRMSSNGNVHVSISGWTGLGKSSCAIALMDWIKPIEPGSLAQRLCFDLHELPGKVARLERGDTALQDELVRTSGEGSRTAQMMLDNLEDTLRKSGRNLIVISPRQQDHGTMQVELEVIAWSPPMQRPSAIPGEWEPWDVCRRCYESTGQAVVQPLRGGRCETCQWQGFSLFLAWVEGIPMGVVPLPWAPASLFATYSTWKDANTQRSIEGRYNDNQQNAKATMSLFENEKFTEWLWLGVNKPKKRDFETAILMYYPGMLTQSQVDRMATFAYEACYSYDRLRERFEWFHSVKPNRGFEKIAGKCYEEHA
jgi:hypothetical protein